jgi:hypothetical protein
MKILSLFIFYGLLSLVAAGSAFALAPISVPEPATVVLLVSGLIGVAGFWGIFKK